MKKIFFLTGVAVCALTLATSCVKDNESASVTSLRNAKTEQIKAAAELAKAQAAAATLTAQADANLKNAQAELAKAEAEYQKAYAEYENAQAERAKAEAEKAKVAAQQQIQSILNQIELDKIQFEYDMAKLVADLEKQKADDAINELNFAAMNYRNAVNNLINAQSQLNNMKTTLARNEVYQVDWEETKAEDIANYKHWIAQNQARIEVYKQYANYTEDIDALRDKVNDLSLKLGKLNDDLNVAYKKWQDASNQRTDEGKDAATKELEENPFWQVFLNWGDIILSDGETEVHFWDTKASRWVYRSTFGERKDVIYYSYTHKDGFVEEGTTNYWVITSEAYVNFDGIYGKIEKVNADVINMRIKEDKAAYAKEKKDLDAALKALNDELKPLKETAAAKLKALNAIEVGAEGYEAAKTAYEAAVLAVNAKQADIDTKAEAVAAKENEIEAYNIIAGFVVNYSENCKTVAALYDAVGEGIASDWKEVGDSYVAYLKAQEEYQAAYDEYDAADTALYSYSPAGASTLADRIKTCENNIKNYQAQIDNYDLDNPSMEQAIETAKKNIALQEEYIKSLEVIANQRKAEYDAVLAKYQNAE